MKQPPRNVVEWVEKTLAETYDLIEKAEQGRAVVGAKHLAKLRADAVVLDQFLNAVDAQ